MQTETMLRFRSSSACILANVNLASSVPAAAAVQRLIDVCRKLHNAAPYQSHFRSAAIRGKAA